MTYAFPPSLYPLRDYLKSQGADTIAFVSARQAAFMAQQLLGTRIKFPSPGSDMTSTMFLIQKAVTEKAANLHVSQAVKSKAITAAADQMLRDAKPVKKGKAKKEKSQWANLKKSRPDFGAHVFAEGIHIFCDGAAVPNPGVGGWGVVVYRDGVEIDSRHGGDVETTNNRMEMSGLLVAIETTKQFSGNSGQLVTIWCDSQYCVEGVNTWMPTWKARGWSKRKFNSPKREEGEIKNLELWQAIDEALGEASKSGSILIKWVKGHLGVVGNERADELAEMGRQHAADQQAGLLINPAEDLDERYRKIMGAM